MELRRRRDRSPTSEVERTLHVASQQLRNFLPTLIEPLGIATEMLSKCMDFIEQQKIRGGTVEERHIRDFELRQSSVIELFTACKYLVNQILSFSVHLNKDTPRSQERLHLMAGESDVCNANVAEYKTKFDDLIQQITHLKNDVARTYRS